MFYPFILMDQLEGNLLPDPYGANEQARLPWRGRITLDIAPGVPGSPDGTSAAEAQVAAFFGTARPSDFSVADGHVTYAGPAGWSFSRFVLHYAALCAAAGGVEAFCIGSEMRAMTWIRGTGNTFPFVEHLRQLAGDVRALLGHGTMIGYAADWSEYFGYQPQDGSGDRFFHLDPLWADEQIDFVGIDNYMPLSDWRNGTDHADAAAGVIHDLDYLRGNIEGGEGYDWYYADAAGSAAQERLPIADGAHGENWVFRYKDILSWMVGDDGGALDLHQRALLHQVGDLDERHGGEVPAEHRAAGRADALGAAIETNLVHRVRLCGRRQGNKPAKQVRRSQELRERAAPCLER